MFSNYLPYHFLSRIVGWFSNTRNPFIKNLFIASFIKYYRVVLADAQIQDPNLFENFNAFFTRKLKDDARLLARTDVVSPVDGTIYFSGSIKDNLLFQAKGHEFSLEDLLAQDESAKHFKNGKFATIYLAPKDYHRVHNPFPGTGKLVKTIYVPGTLFPVKPKTAAKVPNLFARNERLICLFETEIGKVALIFVGACIVAAIETTWAGLVAPNDFQSFQETVFSDNAPIFKQGDDLGCFQLGSTVILLFPENTIEFLETVKAGDTVRMGCGLASKR